MSTLTIVAPPVGPTPQVAPGKLVDTPASVRPGDVPRAGIVVQLSEQVRQLNDSEKQDNDERKNEFRDRELTDEQEREVQELKKTDRDVRAHEAAHKAAAGAYARGAAQFETVVGPDGRRYAVGGEVAIDTSPVAGNPEATVQKMEQVARAALAPSDPSAQDRAVAAQARQASAEARREIILERAEERQAKEAEAAEADAAESENRLDAPEESDAPEEVSAEDDAPSARVDASAPSAESSRSESAPASGHEGESATEAAAHGHAPGDSCPLCLAQGTQPPRQHGGLDLSA